MIDPAIWKRVKRDQSLGRGPFASPVVTPSIMMDAYGADLTLASAAFALDRLGLRKVTASTRLGEQTFWIVSGSMTPKAALTHVLQASGR